MIYKWNTVSTETFKDIFNTFWNNEGNTENIVLEVQNILPRNGDPDSTRLFFSSGINLEDWKKYDSFAFDMLSAANNSLFKCCGKTDIIKPKLYMCMTDNGPRFTPIGSSTDREEMIFKGLVDDDLESITDPTAKLLTSISNKFLKIKIVDGKKSFIRTRAMSLDDWKEHLLYYSENNTYKTEFIKNDYITL